ncbi:MAG TPA: hypothetical protein VFT72_02030 [Opitutaceae bacterium]|nr:hypothetical protein [Opitutaceae bacterium]
MPSRYERLRQKLEIARAHLAELERRAAEQDAKTQALANLPAEHGFDNVEDFIAAVRFSVENEHGEPRPHPAANITAEAPARGIAAAKAQATETRNENAPGSEEDREPATRLANAPAETETAPRSGLNGTSTAPSEPSAAPESQAPAPTLPTGTSLSDPANFGLIPDLTLLENGLPESLIQRDQLRQSLEFARQVLHTSRVPAAVWRAWRDFERRGTEIFKQAR